MTATPNPPGQPSQPTETPAEPTEEDLQRRCTCGRELKRGVGPDACIGCDKPEAECACGPNE